MNDNSIKISTEDLKAVSASLKSQRDTLTGIYKSEILPTMNKSASCFAVAGLNTSDISEAFKKTFNNIETNLNALIDLLDNNIIKSYSELSYAIQRMFTDDFANQLSELIGLRTLYTGGYGYIKPAGPHYEEFDINNNISYSAKSNTIGKDSSTTTK